jgi:L-aspartate oxidase
MAERHPKAELAPRDIVSQEIVKEMKRFGKPYIYLDARHIGKEKLLTDFPTICQTCLEAGFNLAEKPIPVCPVAHFMIGGVKTDLEGRTGIEGLYAAGECSCTGLHGANRLASNSLLEGVVFSRLIGENLRMKKLAVEKRPFASKKTGDKVLETASRKKLKQKLLDYTGIIRNGDGLENMIAFCEEQEGALPSRDVMSMELANMLTLAKIISRKALEREETRGVHFRMDFPYQKETLKVHSECRLGT